jgi:hypothetical protein
MKRGHVALRIFVYLFCLLFLLISVALRRTVINRQRAADPVSYITELRKHGKPVTVVRVKSEIFNVKEKFTVVPIEDAKFEGYVTREMAASLKEGQTVNVLNGYSGITGKISYLSLEVDMMSGLYHLEIEFEESIMCDSGKLLVETTVGEHKDIIEVPNDVLQIEKGKFYLWKVIDGKAHQEEVVLSARSGYSSIVRSGLNREDILVITGQAQLDEGDRVRIMNNNNKSHLE